VLEPQHRFPALVLIAGAAVLLGSIVLGERMGERVIGQATQRTPQAIPLVTPEPYRTAGPFGPGWADTETLSAAADPRFPDPRVPPKPLPTAPPPPTPAPTPAPPVANPNLPIWRQQPLPTMAPSSGHASPLASPASSPAAASVAAPATPRPCPQCSHWRRMLI
jgi:hypothetical protein